MTDLYVNLNEIRDRDGGFVAKPDLLSPGAAARFGRVMARWHAGSTGQIDSGDLEDFVDLYRMLRIPDPGNIDVDRVWAKNKQGPPWGRGRRKLTWGADWLRIPVGEDADGNPVYLDLKQLQEWAGQGHFVMMVGASGTGKTIALSTIVAALCLTHSWLDVIVSVYDLKGSALATNVAGFPHVVAGQCDLQDDRLWVIRMADVIDGDIDRRFQIIHNAGCTEFEEYWWRRHHCGEPLEHLPYHVIVIDEVARLFKLLPNADEFIERASKQARSAGVRTILGNQGLEPELDETMKNVFIKWCLRTERSSRDSYEMLGNNEAEHLPVDPPGAAILNTKKGRWQFQGAMVMKPYIPPAPNTSDTVEGDPEWPGVAEFKAVGMPDAPMREVVEEPPPEIPLGPDGRELTQIKATILSMQKTAAERPDLPVPAPHWLPLLAPISVEEMVDRYLGRSWRESYGQAPDLLSGTRFLVGLKDLPREQLQPVWTVDASGHLPIVGRGGAGKTVALTTVICSSALMYTPQRVQWFVTACSGTYLDMVARLPHCAAFARGNDPIRAARMVTDLLELIELREREFARLGIHTFDMFLARKFGNRPGGVPSDRYGDAFYAIDGWALFAERFPELVPKVEEIMQRGPTLGVHVVLTMTGWTGNALTTAMRSLWTKANIELKMSGIHDDYTTNNAEVAKVVPFGTQKIHRKPSGSGEAAATVEIKIVGRATTDDGYHGQVGLAERRDGGDVAEAVLAVAPADETLKVKVLPLRVELAEVFDGWEPRPGLVPFGLSENGLAVACADFAASPHLIVTGRADCGQTTALRTVIQSIQSVWEGAAVYVADPNTDLLLAVEDDDHYSHEETGIRRVCREIAQMLEPRLPAQELGQREILAGARDWKGPEIFLVVDREETLAGWDTSGGYDPDHNHPLAVLEPYIAKGRHVGFHLVLSRNIREWQRHPNAVMMALLKMNTPAVIMDGDKQDGPVIGTTRAVPSAPGRGIFRTDRAEVSVQVALPNTTNVGA